MEQENKNTTENVATATTEVAAAPVETNKSNLKKFKVRLSIGTKLVSLIAILLMCSVVGLVFLSTKMFIEDNTALIQQINSDAATGLASQMRELFNNLNEKMRVMGSSITNEAITKEYFAKDKDFVSVFVYKHEADGSATITGKAVSPDWMSGADPEGAKLTDIIMSAKDYKQDQVVQGDIQISSVKLPDDTSGVILGVPFMAGEDGKFTHTMAAIVRQTRFVKMFSESDIVTSFMVDNKGRLLAHPDATRVAASENMAGLAIVKQLLEGKFNNGQTRYVDAASGEARLGAFRMVGFGGLAIVSEVPEAKAFEAAKKVVYRSVLVGVIVLSLAFFIGFIYSGTITKPIRALVEAAKSIAEGNFKINLTAKSKDEVGHLALAFNEMAMGLEERDRVKETFNKFHNKEIAEKLLSGEVKLGGERREAVIFFSDVRGFTGMSESMEPEQVVEMLNEYMTKMVHVITSNNGVVDKYVGDAIMALWGVPLSKGNDAYHAVMACIGMRRELNALNELRISRGQGPLKIGMGLNMGQVIAGNIGSNEKMEYTVIGDSVNTASRIESMTKEYGSDFLCSERIYEAVKDRIIFEKCKAAKVKGKTDALIVYKVRGYIDEQGNQVIVETPYSTYASEKSDKVQHDDKPEHAAEEVAPVAVTPVAVAPVVEAAAPVTMEAPIMMEAPVAIAPTPVAVAPAPQTFASSEPVIEYRTKQIEVVQIKASVPTPPPVVAAEPVAPVYVAPVAVAPPVQTVSAAPKMIPPAPPRIVAAPVAPPAPPKPVATPMDEVASMIENMILIPTDEHKRTIESQFEEGTSSTMYASSSKTNEWYFKVENEVFGSFSDQEVIDGLKARELVPSMLASPSAKGPWAPLQTQAAFNSIFKKAA